MNPKYDFFEKFKKIKKCIRLVKKKNNTSNDKN